MEENYEITTETLRTGLDEVLDWLKDEIMSASKNAPFTEQGKKSGPSEFSQDVNAYVELWKIRQAELNRDLESDIKHAEIDRKNCEYLESIAKRTEELKLKARELDLRDEDSDNNSRIRNREIDIRADEFKLKEEELKLKAEESQNDSKTRARETELKEREMYVKELSAKENCRWWNKPLVQTGAICATTLVVNGIALYFNASETPLKNIFSNWMIRPRL